MLNEFQSCVELYKFTIKKLINNHIFLNEVFTEVTHYLSVRNKLNSKIKTLIKQNIFSDRLRNICINFEAAFSSSRFLMDFIDRAQRLSASSSSESKKFYNSHSSFIFISLLKETFGIITKASSNFPENFGFKSEGEVIGKLITHFLPHIIK